MKLIQLFDHMFILRPMLHLPIWTILILAFYRAQNQTSSIFLLPAVLLLGTAVFGAVFILNQIYDIESDRLNNKLFFLPREIISVGVAWIMAVALNVVSVLIGFYLSFTVGFVILLIIVLGILYSVPPIALKNKAWSAAIANGLGHGTFVFILGYCAGNGSFITGIIKSIPYFMAVTAVYIGTTLPDVKGDRETGKLTIGVVYGERRAKHIILGFYIVAVLTGLLFNDTPFVIASLLTAPFYLWAVFSPETKITVLAVKVSIITLALAAGYFYPVYIIFLIGLIYGTRIYYKQRFDIEYPSIK